MHQSLVDHPKILEVFGFSVCADTISKSLAEMHVDATKLASVSKIVLV